MSAALDLATFIIEPIGTNINSPSSFTVRKRFQGSETTTSYATTEVTMMFDDIMDLLSRPTSTSSNMKGGLLYLKNGTYLLNSSDGIRVSDTTDDQDVSVRIVGETRENTIIKANVSQTADVIATHSTLEVQNITFDGNGSTGVSAIVPNSSGDSNKVLRVKNCRFTGFNDFDIIIGHNMYGFELANSQFDNHLVSNDQCAFECTGWANIYGNIFDKTTGTLTGESLTSGWVQNVNIYNNYINRTTHDNGGISIEAFDSNGPNANIHITGNILVNAGISIGSSGADYTTTLRNVTIDSNALFGGGIRILGPSTLDPAVNNEIMDWSVINNTMINPKEHGIKAWRTSQGFIKGNIIKNSNLLSISPGSVGLIHLESCLDMVCEHNSLYMDPNADTDVSPSGIKYVNGANLTIRNNRIINRNATNPSYSSSGSQTGNTLISRSL